MTGQIVDLATNFSKGLGMCWGRLYLDLSAAFDSILREFLIADSTYDVQLVQSSLKALNISDEMCDREAITERNLIRRTGRRGRRHAHSHLDCVLKRDARQRRFGCMDETRQSTRVPAGRYCLQPDVRTGVA